MIEIASRQYSSAAVRPVGKPMVRASEVTPVGAVWPWACGWWNPNSRIAHRVFLPEKTLERMFLVRPAKLVERPALDLANPLARQTHLLTDLPQCLRLIIG